MTVLRTRDGPPLRGRHFGRDRAAHRWSTVDRVLVAPAKPIAVRCRRDQSPRAGHARRLRRSSACNSGGPWNCSERIGHSRPPVSHRRRRQTRTMVISRSVATHCGVRAPRTDAPSRTVLGRQGRADLVEVGRAALCARRLARPAWVARASGRCSGCAVVCASIFSAVRVPSSGAPALRHRRGESCGCRCVLAIANNDGGQ